MSLSRSDERCADELRSDNTTIVKIKSHGEIVGELRVLNGAKIDIKGDGPLVNSKVSPLTMTYKDGVAIQIGKTGDRPVNLTADEVEISVTVK